MPALPWPRRARLDPGILDSAALQVTPGASGAPATAGFGRTGYGRKTTGPWPATLDGGYPVPFRPKPGAREGGGRRPHLLRAFYLERRARRVGISGHTGSMQGMSLRLSLR